MTTTNEKIRNVAEVAAKIMIGEKLHPNQQKLERDRGQDFQHCRIIA